MKDINSLEHTKWRCQYHVVFAPKYRRQIIYREIKGAIGYILRKLCEQKGVEIIEANACADHIHMLIAIQPKYSVSQIMGYLKGKAIIAVLVACISFTALASSRPLSVSSTLPRTKSLICPLIISSLNYTIFSDMVCFLLSECCVVTSF